MKTVNSISGGRSSADMAYNNPADYELFSVVCIDDHNANNKFWKKNPELRLRISDKLQKYNPEYGEFISTAEHPQTLVAMLELEQRLGREIIWLRGMSFETLIQTFRLIPNRYKRVCTTEFKIRPIYDFVKKHIGEKVDMRIGFRYDEFDRIPKQFFSFKKPKQKKITNQIDLFQHLDKIIKIKPKHHHTIDYFLNQISESSRSVVEKVFDLENVMQRYHNNDIFIKKNQPSFFENNDWRVLSYPSVEQKVHHKMVVDSMNRLNIEFPEDSNCQMCFWKQENQLRRNFDTFEPLMLWAGVQEAIQGNTFKDNISLLDIRKLGLQTQFQFGGGSGCSSAHCTD